ncbi:hypothetical protein SCANM63S_00521 [Streptomyces canarius]
MRPCSRRSRARVHGNHPCLDSTFHRGVLAELYDEFHVDIADLKNNLFVLSSVSCSYKIVTNGLYGANKVKPAEVRLHALPPPSWMIQKDGTPLASCMY